MPKPPSNAWRSGTGRGLRRCPGHSPCEPARHGARHRRSATAVLSINLVFVNQELLIALGLSGTGLATVPYALSMSSPQLMSTPTMRRQVSLTQLYPAVLSRWVSGSVGRPTRPRAYPAPVPLHPRSGNGYPGRCGHRPYPRTSPRSADMCAWSG